MGLSISLIFKTAQTGKTWRLALMSITYMLNVLCGRLWQRKEVLRQWVRRDAGLAWHRNSVILLAKTLALSWGPTMRGSSIHLRCSSLEPVYRYSVWPFFFFDCFTKICAHFTLCKSYSKIMFLWMCLHALRYSNIQNVIMWALGIYINWSEFWLNASFEKLTVTKH